MPLLPFPSAFIDQITSFAWNEEWIATVEENQMPSIYSLATLLTPAPCQLSLGGVLLC